jgi:two-component system sensor kinase FixL
MEENMQALHVMSKDFLQFFDISPDALLVINQTGNIIIVNAQVEHDFGYSRSELFGHSLEMLLPERFSKIHISHRDHYFAALRPRPMGVGLQLFGLRKDKTEFPVDISLRPLLLDNTPHVIAAIRDMTEQKRYDTFLSMASHDLRTPLASIQIIAQMFVRNLDRPYPTTQQQREQATQIAREALGEMTSQISRLNRLIEDLLDVSRTTAGHLSLTLSSFAIGEIVQEAVLSMENTVNTHTFRVRGDESQFVYADRDRIRQVIANFLSNAVKYSPGAQKVDIAISSTVDSVIVSVHDDGIGIAKEQQPRLFRRYYRLTDDEHKKYGGLGIGLYIAASIVQHHNGKIWAESDAKKGATFSFSLPITGPTME